MAVMPLEHRDCASYGRVVQLHVNVFVGFIRGYSILIHDETSALDLAFIVPDRSIHADIHCYILAAYIGANWISIKNINAITSFLGVILNAEFSFAKMMFVVFVSVESTALVAWVGQRVFILV